jgi:hypothetical protein
LYLRQNVRVSAAVAATPLLVARGVLLLTNAFLEMCVELTRLVLLVRLSLSSSRFGC